MSKVFMVIFLIFGTVVGSGFSSGKEIMVFFTRFGNLSYLYILLAGILLFFVFYFFLTYGRRLVKKFEDSKFLNVLVILICTVFCSSMFAGIKNLLSYFPLWLDILFIVLILFFCLLSTIHGIRVLEKINLVLMPIASFIFLIVLFFCLSLQEGEILLGINAWAGMLYSPLYVALNTSLGGIVIAKSGEGLSKKQVLLVCFLTTFLLLIFLFLGNFVLQRNGQSYFTEMPFLSIVGENQTIFILSFLVILVGCFTTLISMCYTLKTSFDKFISDKIFSTILSVFLPFAISLLGFSQIISFLYPICSVLGICVLFYLFFSSISLTKDEKDEVETFKND